MRTKKSEESG